MPPEIPEGDRVRLAHMVWAAYDAMDFTRGRDRASLDTNRMLLRATGHCLREIGQSASKVTSPTRSLAPEVPWNMIADMRRRLDPAYFALRDQRDLVWSVVTDDLPFLIRALTALLGTVPDRGDGLARAGGLSAAGPTDD
jgi:uncharacterized protein with HEPN domain